VQLTDEFVKKQIPSSSGLADAEVKLYEAQRLKVQYSAINFHII